MASLASGHLAWDGSGLAHVASLSLGYCLATEKKRSMVATAGTGAGGREGQGPAGVHQTQSPTVDEAALAPTLAMGGTLPYAPYLSIRVFRRVAAASGLSCHRWIEPGTNPNPQRTKNGKEESA